MPQMFPLNWIALFIYFSITFIIFNILNYFNINNIKKSIKLNFKKKINFNWKW